MWALLLDSTAELLRSQTALTDRGSQEWKAHSELGWDRLFFFLNHLSDMIKINHNKNILFQKSNNENGLQFTLIAPDHRSNKETLSNCIMTSSKKWRGLLSRLILLRNPSRGVRWNRGPWSISFFTCWTSPRVHEAGRNERTLYNHSQWEGTGWVNVPFPFNSFLLIHTPSLLPSQQTKAQKKKKKKMCPPSLSRAQSSPVPQLVHLHFRRGIKPAGI